MAVSNPQDHLSDKTAGGDAGAKKAGRACNVCGVKLSSYNPNPTCWQHTIGHPWRGPSAKPRYD